MERLQRVIAARGAASRRTAETLITEGRVQVNGEVVTELGRRVDPLADEIRVDGKVLRPQRLRTILLNKPAGYITTTKDERGRQTVMDLVPSRQRLFPVGRLDRDTEGLLLLTNDGELANRVMHPRYEIAKEYHVVTDRRPTDAAMQRVREGVRIDGRLVVPEEFRILRETREGIILKIVIHEGFYHAVRRIMEAVGIEVRKLRRFRIGPISVQGVPVGGWRELTAGELTQLGEALHFDRDLVVESSLPDAPLQKLSAKAPAKRPARPGRPVTPQRGARPAAARRGTRSFAAFREGQPLPADSRRPAAADPEAQSERAAANQRPSRAAASDKRNAGSRPSTEPTTPAPRRGSAKQRLGGNAIPKPDRPEGSRGRGPASPGPTGRRETERGAAGGGPRRPTPKPDPMGVPRRRRKPVKGGRNG